MFHCNYGKNIDIGDNVIININCKFIDDEKITIGENSVIGAGSVVNSSIPDNCVAVGNSCRPIIDFDDIRKNNKK